jgi:hypothetical protein
MTPDMTWWVRLADSVRAAGRGEAPLDEPVRMVRDGLGFDCATLVGPQRATSGEAHPVLVNLDYPGDAIRFISTTYAAECPAHRYITEHRVAGRFIDLPYDFRSSRTYREALKPNGFHEGLTLPLGVLRHGTPRPGFLALSSTHGRPLRDESLLGLTMLASEIASLTDPRVSSPSAPADLVVWAGRGRLDVRVGDLAEGPFSARDVAHQSGARLPAPRWDTGLVARHHRSRRRRSPDPHPAGPRRRPSDPAGTRRGGSAVPRMDQRRDRRSPGHLRPNHPDPRGVRADEDRSAQPDRPRARGPAPGPGQPRRDPLRGRGEPQLPAGIDGNPREGRGCRKSPGRGCGPGSFASLRAAYQFRWGT